MNKRLCGVEDILQ